MKNEKYKILIVTDEKNGEIGISFEGAEFMTVDEALVFFGEFALKLREADLRSSIK